MKPTQQNIAKALGVSQPFVCMIFKGVEPISWPLASKLSDLFPGKSLREWKNSGPEDIKHAFRNLEMEKVA